MDEPLWSPHTPPPPPDTAGWKPDPLERHQLRYHNGTGWTEHVADNGTSSIDRIGGPISEPQPATTQDDTALPSYIILGAAAATIIGSLGPWLTAPFGTTANGTEGDGLVLIVLALIVIAIAAVNFKRARRGTSILAAGVALLLAVFGVGVLVYQLDNIADEPTMQIGWGLWLATIGSVSAFAGAAWHATLTPSRPRTRRRDDDTIGLGWTVIAVLFPLAGLIYGVVQLARKRTNAGTAAIVAAIATIVVWLALVAVVGNG